MTLYEISDKYKILMESIDAYEDEMLDKDSFNNALEQINDKFEDKVLAVASFIKNLESDQHALETHQKETRIKIDRIKKKVEWLEYYIKHNMDSVNVKKVENALISVSIQPSHDKIDMDDEDVLPDEYLVWSKRVNLNKLKADLKGGILVDGVRLIRSEHLRIK